MTSDPWCSAAGQSPTWDGIELSPCFRRRVFNGLLPLTFLGLTTLALLLRVILTRSLAHTRPTITATTEPLSSARTISEAEDLEVEKAAQLSAGSQATEGVGKVNGHSMKQGCDIGVTLMLMSILGVQIASFVLALRKGEAGNGWLAVDVAAWLWTLILFMAAHSSTWSSVVPYLIVPWLLVATSTSFLDLYFTLFASPSTYALTSYACVLGLRIVALLLVLATPRPSPTTTSSSSVLPPPLEANSSLLSTMVFSYLDPLLYKMAFPRPEDPPYSLASVPDLLPEDKSAEALRSYREGLKFLGRPRGLIISLLWFNREMLVLGHFWSYVKVLVIALPAYGLKLLLDHLAKRSRGELAPTHVAVLLALGIAAAQLVKAVAAAQSLTTSTTILIRTRALLVSEVFAKALRRSGGGTTSTAKGADITNIIGSDADDVAPAISRINIVFELFFSIIISMAFLVHVLGLAAFAGVGVLFLTMPLQTRFGQLFQRYQMRLRKTSDARISLVTEVIHGIRLVKYEAWEDVMRVKMDELRRQELAALWTKSLLRIVDLLFMSFTPIFVAVVTFVCHTKVLHRELDAASAFAGLALLQTIALPLDSFVVLLVDMITALVALRRIEAFLREPDTRKYSLLQTTAPVKIGFENASFTWASNPDEELGPNDFALRDISLDFPIGKLTAIVGRVGSGKSTLLTSLLGETTLISGRIFLPSPISRSVDSTVLTDSVAYCAQSPWLLNDTIQANIVFGAPKDEDRYQQVLDACALGPDLAMFELGDATEVGERGVVLSGGQKARICLARAVYSSAKIILLDDCLAAVDAHTASHLVSRCLAGPLLADRSVIIITHAIDLILPVCSFLVKIENGRVASAGPPETLLHAELEQLATQAPKDAAPIDDSKDETADANNERIQKLQLVKTEAQSTGSISRGLYIYYLRAMGGWWPALVAFGFFGAAQLSEIATSVALRFWAGSYDSPSKAATVMHDTDFWLMVYCLFALMDLVLFAARVAFWLRRALYAAETIYGDLVTSLLRTTVRFYDSTPTGRILNRLSADTNIVDGALPTLMMFLIFELFGVAGILGTITFIFPLFFLPASVILAIYGTIGFFYLTACQEFQRSGSVAKSPVFSLFGEAINGVVTLRAYGDTLRFLRKVFGLLDDQTRPTAITNVANRWLSIRCDLAGAAVSLATALFVVFSVRLDAALAGFVLSFALNFSEKTLYTTRFWVQNAIHMNALERVKEYTEIVQETQGGLVPPAIWPSRDGSIEVEDLCVRYTAELPLALQGISFRVKPREKVGIVGRTGSGKSTLALSFFRFVEASAGKIIIDGIDIRTLSLAELRSRLVIVPQDALLLSGPLRQSLDPYEKHSDADLWDAVRQVHLAAPVDGTQAAPDQRFVVTSLDMEVENGGKNFSAGERQLVALARALLKLRSSSILILDESTASLDHATDAKIQATLREVMPDATVLCVAHRLRTIIDYPKALVMGDGKVLEYDAPWTLLERKDSAFSELCRRSGEEDVLRAMAFAARDAQI